MFSVTVKQKTSKAGKEYTVLEVMFPNGYTKLVFLEKAEEYMVNDFITA